MIATGGQTFSHARQKIQSGSLIWSGFFVDATFPGKSANSKTFTGHASMQAPSATHISKSTETNSPQTPMTLLSVPTRPQVLSSFPVSVLNNAVRSILSLYSTSIGPGTTALPSLCITCFLPATFGFGGSNTGFGFASGTICASGVSSSNFTNDSSSEIFSVFI